MDLIKNWSDIRRHFNRSFKSNFHVAIASVDVDGNPTITPIGSLFLNGNQTGFYFEKFPKKLRTNSESNSNTCILAVNSSKRFWLKALLTGAFNSYPALWKIRTETKSERY